MNAIRINDERKEILLILSPFLVIALGYTTARVAGIVLGDWAWVPLTAVFWTTLGILISVHGGMARWREWLQPSKGHWRWIVLAILSGLLPLPVFLLDWETIRPLWVWLPWLLFAFINPWFEEGYWRGVLLDVTSHWPNWQRILYTSAVFAVSHPFMWGVHSLVNRTIFVWGSTFIMGLVWSAVYIKTKSLRWAIVAHIMVDLLNLSVAAFLNLILP
ncbi:MAG: CPBP family intramembrane glutamic endopeptidase [Chloroflexota bacterium]